MNDKASDVIWIVLIVFLLIIIYNNKNKIIENSPIERETEAVVDSLNKVVDSIDVRIDTIYIIINKTIKEKNEKVQEIYNLNDTATVNLFYKLIGK